jgi:hypothetical protein
MVQISSVEYNKAIVFKSQGEGEISESVNQWVSERKTDDGRV